MIDEFGICEEDEKIIDAVMAGIRKGKKSSPIPSLITREQLKEELKDSKATVSDVEEDLLIVIGNNKHRVSFHGDYLSIYPLIAFQGKRYCSFRTVETKEELKVFISVFK